MSKKTVLSRKRAFLLTALVSLALLLGCAHSPPTEPHDPLESMNRVIFDTNMTLDKHILRPLAVGYDKVTPQPVQTGVGNFFDNVLEPITIVNSVLQLKFDTFNIALGRLLINSTVGIGGLFDVASKLGIEDPREDFGQTLGYWGVGRGAYLVLPLFGPSSNRDLVGDIGDLFVNPIHHIDSLALQLSLMSVHVLNQRAAFLDFDSVLEQQFDPYVFMRTYYLNQRHAAVRDEQDDNDDEDGMAHDNIGILP